MINEREGGKKWRERERRGEGGIPYCWLHVSEAEFKFQNIFCFASELLCHQMNQRTIMGRCLQRRAHTQIEKKLVILHHTIKRIMLTWQFSGSLVLSIGSGQAAVEMIGTLRFGIGRQKSILKLD